MPERPGAGRGMSYPRGGVTFTEILVWASPRSMRAFQSSGRPSKPRDCQNRSLLGFIWLERFSRSCLLLKAYLLQISMGTVHGS